MKTIDTHIADDMAKKLLSLRGEEDELKETMVSIMRYQKLKEIRTNSGMITLAEERDVMVINKEKLEEILLRRFNLDPDELKSAIADSHDHRLAKGHVCLYSGSRYSKDEKAA